MSRVNYVNLLQVHVISDTQIYTGADKSLARPGRKQARATEDFDVFLTVHHSIDLFQLPT